MSSMNHVACSMEDTKDGVAVSVLHATYYLLLQPEVAR
jgi:hypothetical protein